MASAYRPRVDVVQHYGATVRIIDPEAVLRTSGVAVGLTGDWPEPVRGVALTVIAASPGALGGTPEAEPVLRGTIRLAGTPTAAPADFLGVAMDLLTAVTSLGGGGGGDTNGRSKAAASRDDEDLPTSVASEAYGRDIAIRHARRRQGRTATVEVPLGPDGDATPEELAAFVRLLLEVATAVGGDDGLVEGRSYVVDASRAAAGTAAHPGLEALGGLDLIVADLRDIAVSFRHPEVMAKWGARRPRGILLYGPPGTGKTTLAKALAVEAGAELREVSAPDIVDKWVGASERNLEKIFAEARAVTRPTVLLFDEFESIISYTGTPSDAASQMNNSLAGLFKQEMNTLAQDNPRVMVVATTNFRGRIDASIVRAGRFDIKVEVPMPDTAGRADILLTMLRRLVTAHETAEFRLLDDDIDVHRLAELTPGFTGADLDEVVRRVQWRKALEEARAGGTADMTPIAHRDFVEAIASMPPPGARQ